MFWETETFRRTPDPEPRETVNRLSAKGATVAALADGHALQQILRPHGDIRIDHRGQESLIAVFDSRELTDLGAALVELDQAAPGARFQLVSLDLGLIYPEQHAASVYYATLRNGSLRVRDEFERRRIARLVRAFWPEIAPRIRRR